MPGLPSGRRVIALGEVDEMARTPANTPPDCGHRSARPTISETCPPGEGIALARGVPRDPHAVWRPRASPAPHGDRPEAVRPVRRVGLPDTSGQRRRRRRLDQESRSHHARRTRRDEDNEEGTRATKTAPRVGVRAPNVKVMLRLYRRVQVQQRQRPGRRSLVPWWWPFDCLGGGLSTALVVVSRQPEASRWRPDARTQLPM